MIIKRVKTAACALVLLFVGAVTGHSQAMSAQQVVPMSVHAPQATLVSTVTSTALETQPDSYTIYANTLVRKLPVMNNDPGRSDPDAEVCRLNHEATGQDIQYGWSSLIDGNIMMMADPNFHGVAPLSYQLCNTTIVGPSTDANVTVLRLIPAKYKRLNPRTVKITDPDAHDMRCQVGGSRFRAVAANSWRKFKTTSHLWVCIIHQPLGDAVAGSNHGLS